MAAMQILQKLALPLSLEPSLAQILVGGFGIQRTYSVSYPISSSLPDSVPSYFSVFPIFLILSLSSSHPPVLFYLFPSFRYLLGISYLMHHVKHYDYENGR